MTVGSVRCVPEDDDFRNCGDAREFSFVFPRAAVRIRRPDSPDFTEDPSVISFYNRGQAYERVAVSRRGDRCEWYAVAPDVIREAVRPFDPAAADHPTRLYSRSNVHGSHGLYLRQRMLFGSLDRRDPPDPLCVHEQTLLLLQAVIAHANGIRRVAEERASDRDIADAAKAVLATRYADRLTLECVAEPLGVSVFRLCRAFRAACGMTVHRYLTDVRLRTALERMKGREADLAQVALDCGFATHSHFSAAFRRAFGAAPSAIRRQLAQS